MVAIATPQAPTILSDNEAITYIAQQAPRYNLDAAAVLADASGEGIGQNHGVGDTNKGGFGSYGPFQLNGSGGELPDVVKAQGQAYAQAWAWSTTGIDYALQRIHDSGAAGLQGADAISNIVKYFERPQDITGAIQSRVSRLPQWQKLLGQGEMPIPGVTVPNPGNGGVTDTPPTPGALTTTAPTVPSGGLLGALQTAIGGTLGPNLANLGIKPDMSGLILLLASLFAILIGAIIWNGDSVKSVAKQSPQIAAKAVMA